MSIYRNFTKVKVKGKAKVKRPYKHEDGACVEIASHRFPILSSYAYLGGARVDRIELLTTHPKIDVMLDSGAFTAYTSGKPINLDTYIKFCHEWEGKLWGYVNLDVIKNPKATYENFLEMRKQGLNPIPVCTTGSKEKQVKQMAEMAGLIMFGGIKGTSIGTKEAIKLRTSWVGKTPVHWLGYADEPMMRAFKPYSVDVTTWQQAMRFGRVNVYLGAGRWIRLTRWEHCTDNKPIPSIAYRVIESAGFTKSDIKNPTKWSISKKYGIFDDCLASVMIRSWVQYSLEFAERFGTRIFLAGVGSCYEADDCVIKWIEKL